MKRIKIDSVLPGDILFTARPKLGSKAIRLASFGEVSHALICVQNSSFIDSTKDGVQARNLQREMFQDDEQIFHFRLQTPLTHELQTLVVDYARAQIGARYSVPEAVRSVVSVKKPRSRKQFCSRLVAQAYKSAGIDLVPDADYCTPNKLMRSPLLVEINVVTEVVSQAEQIWWDTHESPLLAMQTAQNFILDTARSLDSRVETFDDLFSLLERRPEVDATVALALLSSGYLDIWRIETTRHPWRYDPSLMAKMTSPSQLAVLRQDCIWTLKDTYSGQIHYAVNLVGLAHLHSQSPRESFRLEIALYATLVHNHQLRREVAYEWLLAHHPSDLKQNMEQIQPHSEQWYLIVDRVEPNLAALTRLNVKAEGQVEVCSSCGDQPSASYRVVNGAQSMPGVPSLRLCNDCLEIRCGMGNVFAEFLS